MASVATVETDKFWAEKIEILSKPALEMFVQDWKKRNGNKNEQKKLCEINWTDSLFDAVDNVPENNARKLDLPLFKLQNAMVPNLGDTIPFAQSTMMAVQNNFLKMRFKVSKEIEFKFLLFKQKLCKKKKEALTSGEVLAFLLDNVGDIKN